jgi:hypothetical protein
MCFWPCCRSLNIRESQRTPNPQLWKCWASPPHLAKVGLRQKNCPQNLSSHHHQLLQFCHFQWLMWWCFIHVGFHHPNFVLEWLFFSFRNPCFLSHYIWWKFFLCALDEWDQIPWVVPFIVDECDLVPCAVSIISPTPLRHKRLKGCRNCEQAFFVRENFHKSFIWESHA